MSLYQEFIDYCTDAEHSSAILYIRQLCDAAEENNAFRLKSLLTSMPLVENGHDCAPFIFVTSALEFLLKFASNTKNKILIESITNIVVHDIPMENSDRFTMEWNGVIQKFQLDACEILEQLNSQNNHRRTLSS